MSTFLDKWLSCLAFFQARMRSRSSFFSTYPLFSSKRWCSLPPSMQMSKVRHAEGGMGFIWLVLKEVTITSTNIALSRIRDANPGRCKGTEKYPIPFCWITKLNSGANSWCYLCCEAPVNPSFLFSYVYWVSWRRQWQPTPILLPGKSHGRRNLVGCSPWGREESDMTEQLHFHFSLSCIGEGNGNPVQCSCLENPRDGGAWWAPVCGVAQGRTQPKRLSSSCSSIECPPDCAGGVGSIPGSGRSPGDGNGNPLQYSCLENPMDRGA